ncbi:MAG TPA: DegT/DnrJ/EryC1/StrS family aminotransferase [Capsulimonadaceae bacterium]|jgi:dTDP-4-amino-4,6-dideoxygalactose transaminase
MYRIGTEELDEIGKVIASKTLFRMGSAANGHQQEVERFEREWAATIGVEHALLLSGGGTGALILALEALGIGPGDEVLVPAYTWMATANAAVAVGAIPVLVEIDESLGMDPVDVERKMTPNVKAIIPVHIAGRPCDMHRLLEVANRHEVAVIEDCCQCDGGSYAGRRVGSYGRLAAFSFNDFKILSCGEGGAVVTSDRTLYDRARVYHDPLTTFASFASDLTVETSVGHQMRASELHGAVMRVQLQRLEGILSDLRRISARFRNELASTSLRLAPSNDQIGDCGINAAFQFATADEARAFATAEGVGGGRPIDTGRHVYSNWEPIMHRRAGHHADMNPFTFPQNKRLRMDYCPTMCPRTLDILARTVYIAVNPDWTSTQVDERIAACRNAAHR